MFRTPFLSLFTIGILSVVLAPRFSAGADRVTLGFETQGFDLDTGTMLGDQTTFDVFGDHPEADIRIGYHADRPIHSVVVHNMARGVELALLANTSFESVADASLPGIVFNSELIDQPFNPGDTLVVRTDTGSLFKIGNSVEDAAGVSFDYEGLDTTTASLFGGQSTKSGNTTELPEGLTRGERQHIQAQITEVDYGVGGGTIPRWPFGLALLMAVAVGGFLAWRPMRHSSRTGRAALAVLVAVATGVLTLGLARAFDLTEQFKLSADDAAGNDHFGFSVSVDGDTTLVGALVNDTVYVFVRSGTSWTLQAKLTGDDTAPGDQFGHSVSLDGDTALVGARLDDDGSFNSGSAYVFVRTGDSWNEQAKLTAKVPASFGHFGFSVSVDGDTALVGAALDDEGSAYVFVRTGTSWTQEAKLTAEDGAAGDRFGGSVSVDGDTALVGARFDRHDFLFRGGSAYVFVRSGVTWNQEAKLTAGDDAAAQDEFGSSVSLDEDTALVGAALDDDLAISSGSAYVFVRSGAAWMEQAKLTADDPAALDRFGASVSLNGDSALLGAEGDDGAAGSAYVFAKSGTSWTQQSKLTASDGFAGDLLGSSVSFDGDTALVGASSDDDAGFASGSAYVFDIAGDPIQTLIDDVEALGLFGIVEFVLVWILNTAQALLAAGNVAWGTAMLNGFINLVDVLPGFLIASGDADALMSSAQAIVDQLNP